MSGKGSNILPLAATEHRVRRRDAASWTMGSPSEGRARVRRGAKARWREQATLRSKGTSKGSCYFERGAKKNPCGLTHTLSATATPRWYTGKQHGHGLIKYLDTHSGSNLGGAERPPITGC